MTIVDLRDVASAEAQRLRAARALVQDGDAAAAEHLDAGGAWITLARSRRLRVALAGRTLQIWRIGFDAGAGRRGESHLLALALEPGAAADEGDIAGVVERLAAHWREEVTATVAAFRDARMRREHAIEAALVRAPSEMQHGLFDRRAEHAEAARAAARLSSAAEHRARIAAIERASVPSPVAPQLLLALVPRR
jgi:hypothetical protein